MDGVKEEGRDATQKINVVDGYDVVVSRRTMG